MKKYSPIILLILIVSIPNFLFVIFGDESTTSTLFKQIGFLLLSGAYIIFPLSFLKPKYYFGILMLFIPFSFLDIFLILVHHNQSTVTHYLSVFATNREESLELIGDFKIYFSSFAILLFSYLYFFKRLISVNFLISAKIRKIIFVTSSFIILLVGTRDVINAVKYQGDNATFNNVLEITKELVSTKAEKSFPFGVVLKVGQSLSEYSKLQGLLNGEIQDYKLLELNKDIKIDNIILIVGESARKESFEFYGYKRNTNPLLSKQENLLVFDSVSTTSNITLSSLIQSLSSVSVGEFDNAYQEKGIYSAFNTAGFNTRVISRQPYQYSSYLNAISMQANVYKFISGDFGKGDSFDNEILDFIDVGRDGKKEGKDFSLIHTMGSHMRYNLRYPKEFEKFKPAISDNEGRFSFDTEMKVRLINAYDNSIIYTDFIISEIIKNLEEKGESSVVLYFSDHGENLYDDARDIVGHGKNIPTKYAIDIPFFIWYSNEYYNSNKVIVDNIKSNTHSKITTEVIFHTLCSIGGFKTDLHNDKFDLTSNKKLNYERLFYTVDKKVISTDSILVNENNMKPYFE